MRDALSIVTCTAGNSFLGEKTVPDFRYSRNNPLVPRASRPAPSTFSPASRFLASSAPLTAVSFLFLSEGTSCATSIVCNRWLFC